MPALYKRRLIKLGNSKVVVLPASWLRYLEGKIGRKVEEVTLEANGEIIIRPADFD